MSELSEDEENAALEVAWGHGNSFDIFRAGILAGLERAAKVCDHVIENGIRIKNLDMQYAAQCCAAAIRATSAPAEEKGK